MGKTPILPRPRSGFLFSIFVISYATLSYGWEFIKLSIIFFFLWLGKIKLIKISEVLVNSSLLPNFGLLSLLPKYLPSPLAEKLQFE